jgi:NhaA family Na+:H+ antiporter
MGSRVTQSLKAFLLALAVIDDIGAILIIAIVYSTGVIFSWIFAALGAVIATLALQKLKVMSKTVYAFVGLLLWYSLYKAGLHPTLAGVIMGLLTPTTPVKDGVDIEDGELTIVELLENRFHSLSSFIVVPIFAFANAGVALSSKAIESAFTSPISWGIIAGLVIGKPVGIYLASISTSKLNVAELPEGSNTRSLIATGSTAGIGFTVAIFIAKLAFTDPAIQDLAVTAVIAGSLLSGLLSVAIFRSAKK